MKNFFKVLVLGFFSLISFTVRADAQDKYIGTVNWYAFSFCPRGELPANGATLPISTYSALFSLLGTYYGGDGITNFRLPDLQSRFAIGTGRGLGLSDYVLGEAAGNESVTLLTNNMPMHTHSLNGSTNRATTTSPTNGTIAQSGSFTNKSGSATTLSPTSVGLAGGSQPFGIMPPYLALTACITVEGIYPSRP